MARTTSQTTSRSTTAAHARTRRAASEAREGVEELKADMGSLKSRLENLAAAGGNEGIANAREIFNRVQSRFNSFMDTDFAEQLGVNNAMDKGREKVEDVRERVQENPIQSIAIAAGVGVLLGMLLHRR